MENLQLLRQASSDLTDLCARVLEEATYSAQTSAATYKGNFLGSGTLRIIEQHHDITTLRVRSFTTYYEQRKWY